MSQPLDDINKPTILVVDDDRGTVELIQMMLQVRGYDVLVAYSGLEAIAMIQDRVKQHSFWDSLPMTGSGKIMKNEIRDRYWKGYEKKVH